MTVTARDFGTPFTEPAAGYAFQAVDQLRQRNLGRVVNQKVNVIVLAIAFDQFRFKVPADLDEDFPQVADRQFRQHITAVFGDED